MLSLIMVSLVVNKIWWCPVVNDALHGKTEDNDQSGAYKNKEVAHKQLSHYIHRTLKRVQRGVEMAAVVDD